RLTDERMAHDVEGVADLLRLLGDLATEEAVARGATPQHLAELEEQRRAIRVRVGGDERWIAIEDASRFRDALGAPLPVGVPQAFLESVADPLGDLVSRYARTHGPFHGIDVAARFGLGLAVAEHALHRLATAGRVAGYSPSMLDELTSTGEVLWAGQGSLPGNDGWVALYLADTAPLLMPHRADDLALTPFHEGVSDALTGGGALFFRTLSDHLASLDDRALVDVLWDLVWAGVITNDTLAPMRVLVASTSRRTTPPRARSGRRGRPVMPVRSGPPTAAGRWSLLPAREPDATRRAHAAAEALPDRHGSLTPRA